jgi:hypothetical protein
MNDWHIDITAIAGLVALGMIGVVAINHGDGETVAAAAVGAIGGWMARGSGKVTTTTAGDPPTQTTTDNL